MDFPTMMQTTPYLAANGTFDADGRVDLVLGAGVMQSYMDNYYGWQLGTNIAVTHVRHVPPAWGAAACANAASGRHLQLC
jgi:hypothetical protein